MNQSIGIIDEPVAPGATDNLDINIHSKSLIDFITDTSTPITVGIQGEWGSGKTSLINSIHHAFESQEKVKQIWINSWEYSLLSTPEEALLKIVNRIIDDLVEADTDKARVDKIKGGAEKIFKGALRVGAQVALGSEAAKVAKELLDSSAQSISELRKQLGSVVNEMAGRSSNPYEKVVIYVDDLDRIEPRNAVAILELLKNIFSIPKCVFILAIDYQVVVKGLEHKFGKQTPENEWEFRAFFDKIIQLPFMMPMGQYNIGKYVNSLLVDIGFVEGEGLDDEAIREIILRTIGGNPRSIKRLANSVSLIQIFVKNKKEMSKEEDAVDGEEEGISSEDEKLLLFSLLCLQIAYPPVYSLLVQEPDFPNWDNDLAFKQTNRSEERTGDNDRLSPDEMKKIFDAEFEIAKQSEDFDEDWEQALYRICYGRPRLKPRVADISKFFSYIKDELLSDQQEIIGDTLAGILSQTSVTSVTSTDQGQQAELPVREKGSYKRVWLNDWESLRKSLEHIEVNQTGIDLTEHLIDQIKELLPDDIEIKYLEKGVSIYVAKHSFFGLKTNSTKKAMGTVTCYILRDFQKDYKIPSIAGIETRPKRIFKGNDKPDTAGGCGGFSLVIPSIEVYEKNKIHINKILYRAYEIGKNDWGKKLGIDIRRGTFKSTLINIENDFEKAEENTFKFLSKDYTYDALS